MQGNVLGQVGGSSKINGIIEEYIVNSGGNISAGDFVKYIGIKSGTDTQLSSINYSGNSMSAVLIDDDKVFVAHAGQPSSHTYNLYGIVCTISGTTITAGTDTLLCTGMQSFNTDISVLLLENNKVFIAHSNEYFNCLYGIVCTISETTITAGTDTQLSSIDDSGSLISAVLIDNNKVLVAHNNTKNNACLHGIICTISETTITAGTDTQLSTNNFTSSSDYNAISAVLIDDNKVFIAHAGKSNNNLYGIICTISGTTITAGTDTQLNSNNPVIEPLSAVLIDDNKVFIARTI